MGEIMHVYVLNDFKHLLAIYMYTPNFFCGASSIWVGHKLSLEILSH